MLIVTVRGQEPAVSMIVGFNVVTGVLVLRKVENLVVRPNLYWRPLTVLNCFSYGLFCLTAEILEKYDRIWTTVWLFAYGSVGLTLIAIPII